MFFRKKGLSPLIATVLLITFSVAVGAVIMTYSGSIGECGTVILNVAKVEGNPKVCFNDETGTIEVTLENGPKEELGKFKLTLQGSRNVDNRDLEAFFGKSETKKLNIPYDQSLLGNLEKLKITPIILNDGKEQVCPLNKALVIEGIKSCT
ncbi:hypothetical protein HYY69_04765 [Candidatus Woesearchaeota archaeon]|nr:hypothetical protein [Candidatus Woesearchaeota archaeon]